MRVCMAASLISQHRGTFQSRVNKCKYIINPSNFSRQYYVVTILPSLAHGTLLRAREKYIFVEILFVEKSNIRVRKKYSIYCPNRTKDMRNISNQRRRSGSLSTELLASRETGPTFCTHAIIPRHIRITYGTTVPVQFSPLSSKERELLATDRHS
jgi:hypothetical protein